MKCFNDISILKTNRILIQNDISNLRFGIHKFPGIFFSFEKLSSRFLEDAGMATVGELNEDSADIPKIYNSQVIFAKLNVIFFLSYYLCHVHGIGNETRYISIKKKIELFLIEIDINFH